jgi:lysophospholipase L1-like esterase
MNPKETSMIDITLIAPSQLNGGEGGGFPMDEFPLQFLAQGDSWFSIGSIPPFLTSNLFDKMSLSQRAVAVTCARPGAELQHITSTTSNRTFLQLLNGKVARRWTALLLSGLGNDVISAAQSPPSSSAATRILAKKSEWRAGSDASRYISQAGWQTFEQHAVDVFQVLLQNRDKSAVNRGIPIVLHTYDFVTARNAGAGLGFGPWLFKAFTAFEIPAADWDALANELLARVRTLILNIAAADASIHVVDTQGTLIPALHTDVGPTVHWQNEIHPTRTGYRLLGDVWEAQLERLFCGP